MPTHARPSDRGPRRAGSVALNVVRGGLMGTAETVPGVSGGTIALMVGVYEDLLTSAGHLLSGLRIAATDGVRGRGLDRAREDLDRVRWDILLPLGVGMAIALVVMSGVMEEVVTEHPFEMNALFFGLVLASLWVPYSLSAAAEPRPRGRSRWSWKDGAAAVAGAVVALVVVGLPAGEVEPTPVVIVVSAFIAVTALVLPGLSGSFLLLTMGLYESTLGAVNDRDLGYLALFALGAVLGLASIVKLLQWLLEHRRRVTLAVLTGVMAGSLRALWPWQDDDRGLQAPSEDLGTAVAFAAAGFVVVVALIVLERVIVARTASTS
ncbi:DUF368 domain-containing protein [Paraoerskovia marina]|uniref:Putative membrane protein n=1 Tax=Paraoerskovia marina TaxID=545619 RepID=A0A1H1RBE9_9CELL|nr:DUF368 domain-containing protein [Paraoerskovia marina]SDS33094.1 putative membrane protein [Paraoerskovia marina]